MSITSIAGAAVIICMLTVIVRQSRQEFSIGILLLGGCVIAAICVSAVSPAIKQLNDLSSRYDLSEGFKPVLKAIGICFIAQTAADTCRDAACTSLASKVETAGKIAVLAVVFPLFERLLGTAVEIING